MTRLPPLSRETAQAIGAERLARLVLVEAYKHGAEREIEDARVEWSRAVAEIVDSLRDDSDMRRAAALAVA